jgi:hypothetical protein
MRTPLLRLVDAGLTALLLDREADPDACTSLGGMRHAPPLAGEAVAKRLVGPVDTSPTRMKIWGRMNGPKCIL